MMSVASVANCEDTVAVAWALCLSVLLVLQAVLRVSCVVGLAESVRDHYLSMLYGNVTLQVIAQLELWNERKSGRYEHKVYVLPKHLDEKVAALHLPKLGAKLTKLTADQAKYINVPVTGPFKPAHYRY